MRALLLAIVLAGCLAPAIPASVATSEPADLALAGCENIAGSFPVPASAARPLLPPGFLPRSAETSLHSVFWVVAVRCDSARVAGVEQGETWMAYGELDVLPSASAALPGFEEHTVPLFALASSDAVVDALGALGLPRVAPAAFDAEALPGGGRRVVVASELGGLTLAAAPTGATSELGEGGWGMFGVESRAVRSRIAGSATGGTAATSALTLTSDGALPLLSDARPVTRGGMVSGFGLAFERID